jgi:hypothetical protein
MTTTDRTEATTGDPNPSRPVDLDYPTLGRLVGAEAQSLAEAAQAVNNELQAVAGATDWEQAATIADQQDELPRSPDELIANLNGIGADAYRLARHVRTLVEFRSIHLAHQADLDGGR